MEVNINARINADRTVNISSVDTAVLMSSIHVKIKQSKIVR